MGYQLGAVNYSLPSSVASRRPSYDSTQLLPGELPRSTDDLDERESFSKPASRGTDSTALGVQQYLFGTEADRTSRRLRQSVGWWLPEILSSALSFACLVSMLIPKRIPGFDKPYG